MIFNIFVRNNARKSINHFQYLQYPEGLAATKTEKNYLIFHIINFLLYEKKYFIFSIRRFYPDIVQ